MQNNTNYSTYERINSNYINASHPYFQYSGRMDFSNPDSVLMLYPGTYIRFRFEGSLIAIRFSQNNKGDGNYIGFILDNIMEDKILLEEDTVDKKYHIIDGLEKGPHEMILFRRNDFTRGNCSFNGIVLGPGCSLLSPPSRPDRRIEVFGDSITAGEASEAYGYEGKQDPEETAHLSNSWYSYANILARILNAEVHNNGQGGLSLQDGYGYYCQPDTLGLETTFDKLNPVPYMGGLTPWDFRRYIPHIVIIAVGQNDSSTHPDVVKDNKLREIWKDKYKNILTDLRGHYQSAYFILTTSILCHDTAWDDMIAEIADEINEKDESINKNSNKKVLTYRYKRLGKGTPGHLRKSEHREMAEELALFIRKLDAPWQE